MAFCFFLQENGHVKINGDVSPKADGEASSLNGSGSAEAPKEPAKAEAGSGDAIEPAPVAEGEAKPDGAAQGATSKQTPKKKKRFSFKKSFKLSGISFRKAKKEAGDASAASSPGEEQGKVEAEEAEESQAAAAAGEGEQASAPKEEKAAPEEAAAPDNQPEPVAKRQEGSDGPGKEEEQPQQPSGESEGGTKPEETSESAEAEPSVAADTAAATEQKEE
ncbi:myristoylated alanine-rich C-kinase substrate-like [Python bivittatus]|uniref:Myristoylated alanine-rich C-kinase substrate-like n=1 Tax=Python bivittatus TaxID=176946 RepID=A0A9F2RCR9_PYTBI|nr:myristoylated alanine-rich C-kinase substrate-like [Python bivittatus]